MTKTQRTRIRGEWFRRCCFISFARSQASTSSGVCSGVTATPVFQNRKEWSLTRRARLKTRPTGSPTRPSCSVMFSASLVRSEFLNALASSSLSPAEEHFGELYSVRGEAAPHVDRFSCRRCPISPSTAAGAGCAVSENATRTSRAARSKLNHALTWHPETKNAPALEQSVRFLRTNRYNSRCRRISTKKNWLNSRFFFVDADTSALFANSLRRALQKKLHQTTLRPCVSPAIGVEPILDVVGKITRTTAGSFQTPRSLSEIPSRPGLGEASIRSCDE